MGASAGVVQGARGAVPARVDADWRELLEFLPSAEREFLALPPETQERFVSAFPELVRHPTRASPTLDIAPLRDRAGRWRLKVAGGDRAIYRIASGRVTLEMFQPRSEVYERLRRYLLSRE
jgi:mRNA-degrading endonuclease RelE of RelBE toxin-antitoxin system